MVGVAGEGSLGFGEVADFEAGGEGFLEAAFEEVDVVDVSFARGADLRRDEVGFVEDLGLAEPKGRTFLGLVEVLRFQLVWLVKDVEVAVEAGDPDHADSVDRGFEVGRVD